VAKQRILHFAKLAVDVPDGLFVMTTRSGHYIHSSGAGAGHLGDPQGSEEVGHEN
jgi:hypothetical protein